MIAHVLQIKNRRGWISKKRKNWCRSEKSCLFLARAWLVFANQHSKRRNTMPFDVSDPEIIAKSAAMAQAFTPEMYACIVSLLPTPQGHAEVHGRLESGYPAFLKGDPEKVKAFEADRSAVKQNLAIIQGLAKVLTIKDPTVLESLHLGQVAEKSSGVNVAVATPSDFKVFYDPNGQIHASVAKVAGAKGYQVWACDGDPNLESNWRLAASSSTCKGMVLTGLNRGKINWLKIRGMRGNVAGPWSHYICLNAV
jgi:hypothetical protein